MSSFERAKKKKDRLSWVNGWMSNVDERNKGRAFVTVYFTSFIDQQITLDWTNNCLKANDKILVGGVHKRFHASVMKIEQVIEHI